MLFRRSKNSRNYDVFLALSFADYVKKDFTENQLSGTTAKNIRAIKINYYTSMVFVSPPVYYQYEYIKNKKLVFDMSYSYAENVNQVGGQVFKKKTGNHKNFVKKCLKLAVKKNNMKIKNGSLSSIKGKYNRSLYEFMKYKKGE